MDHKVYGTTLLGARGQLVIPADARKDLKLNPGDRVLIVGKYNKMLGLIKAEELGDLIELMMEKISSKDISQEMKKQALKMLEKFKNSYNRNKH